MFIYTLHTCFTDRIQESVLCFRFLNLFKALSVENEESLVKVRFRDFLRRRISHLN